MKRPKNEPQSASHTVHTQLLIQNSPLILKEMGINQLYMYFLYLLNPASADYQMILAFIFLLNICMFNPLIHYSYVELA